MFGRVYPFRLRASDSDSESKESHPEKESESDCARISFSNFTMSRCLELSFGCWVCFGRLHCSLFFLFRDFWATLEMILPSKFFPGHAACLMFSVPTLSSPEPHVSFYVDSTKIACLLEELNFSRNLSTCTHLFSTTSVITFSHALFHCSFVLDFVADPLSWQCICGALYLSSRILVTTSHCFGELERMFRWLMCNTIKGHFTLKKIGKNVIFPVKGNDVLLNLVRIALAISRVMTWFFFLQALHFDSLLQCFLVWSVAQQFVQSRCLTTLGCP